MSSTLNFRTAEEWLSLDLTADESEIVIGSRDQPTIRSFTKNIVEGGEKEFKTTVMKRMMMGLSSGQTVFAQLPAPRAFKVVYVHGELSPAEIQERTRAAAQGLPRPLDKFWQGKDLKINLCTALGQQALKQLVQAYAPEVLVLDPWQSFIPGCDENEFKDVSKATHFLDQLIEDHKITLFLVTHTGKDRNRGTRGHSSLAGWRDTLIRLDRKGKNLVEVKIEPRWAAPVPPFNLKFEKGTVWPTEDDSLTKQAAQIRDLVKERGGRCKKEDIGNALNLGADALRKALARAKDQGALALAGEEVLLPDHAETFRQLEATFTGG